MASVQDFRGELVFFLKVLFFGGGWLSDPQTGELYSSYATDRIQAQRIFARQFPLLAQSYAFTLAPGELGYAVRLWQIEEDRASDSNVTSKIVGLEISPHRAITQDEREGDYTGQSTAISGATILPFSQMLEHQERLLSRSYWANSAVFGPASLDEWIDGPRITSAPERVDNVISYTMEAIVRIKPD